MQKEFVTKYSYVVVIVTRLWTQRESKVRKIVTLVRHDNRNHKAGGINQHLFLSTFKHFQRKKLTEEYRLRHKNINDITKPR